MKPINSEASHFAQLDHFFHPQSIAIVGASERGMYPAGLLHSLLDNGFPGPIYPVNPGREAVFGLACYPDLTHLPEVPDLVVLVVRRHLVIAILRQCIELCVPAALVISAGFAEADAEGKKLQLEMAGLLANTPLTIIGPNCAGLANIPGKVIVTRLTSVPETGSLSFVSQSGALMMALSGLFVDRRLGMSRLLSLGNQVNVSLADGLAYLARDDATRIIGAFVEGVQDGRRFAAALQLAMEAGKPIVMVKSGRTSAGQEAAKTHTAAMAGSDRVFSAVCRQMGVILVDDVDELMDTVQLLAAFDPHLNGRGHIALVTQSGGMGSLAADLCQRMGLPLPALSPDLQEALRTLPHLLQFDDFGNPADVRGAALIGEAAAQTLAPFLSDRDIDVVVLLLAKSTWRAGEVETAQAIVQAAQAVNKRLLAVWVGQRSKGDQEGSRSAADYLVEAGIPTFDSPKRAIQALARAVNYHRYRAKWLADSKDLEKHN
ncbi:MAG: CoA-binding protein [Candidatus Promineifilaceae bacterium]|nr:CoA-binding protein [Candidatus Promineifilaceae bacterium]